MITTGKLAIGPYGISAEPRYISLAAVVGKARSEGFSVRMFAKSVGLSHSTIQNALSGKYKLGTRAADAIAKATGGHAVYVDDQFMFIV